MIKKETRTMKNIKFYNHIFGLSILFFISASSYAASFDCAKSSTKIEKLICTNENLSQLDNELARLYTATKSQNPNIVSQQREWLKKKRGTCETVDCLSQAYREQIFSLKQCRNCLVSEHAIIGYWENINNGFFEEMSFSINNEEHDFNSWRHNHPEMIGKWKIENCTLIIWSPDNKELNFELKLQKLSRNILHVYDNENNKNATYQKLLKKQ